MEEEAEAVTIDTEGTVDTLAILASASRNFGRVQVARKQSELSWAP